MQHDSFVCDISLTYTCHSSSIHQTPIYIDDLYTSIYQTQLTHTWDTTHVYGCRVWYTDVYRSSMYIDVYRSSMYIDVYIYIYTHLYTRHDSPIPGTRLTYTRDMPHLYLGHDSFICHRHPYCTQHQDFWTSCTKQRPWLQEMVFFFFCTGNLSVLQGNVSCSARECVFEGGDKDFWTSGIGFSRGKWSIFKGMCVVP